MPFPPPETLIERLHQGDLRVLSRLITRVENGAEGTFAMLGELWSSRERGRVLGVTGPPGAGKSTLVDRLISAMRSAGHRVAVLAVDPSSPFSGGAILGDRIRMQSHAADSGVFIRSLGTRGHHGGLSRTTHEAAILCAAAGFDRILIETVGVGQTELEVVGMADQVLVLLVPESGDVIQTMKAGLLEGGDVFAVNKCDRPGADSLIGGLVAMIEEGANLHGSERSPVFGVSALAGDGMDDLLKELCGRLDAGRISPRQLPAVDWAARLLGEEVGRRAARDLVQRMAEGGDLTDRAEELRRGTTNPYRFVRALLDES